MSAHYVSVPLPYGGISRSLKRVVLYKIQVTHKELITWKTNTQPYMYEHNSMLAALELRLQNIKLDYTSAQAASQQNMVSNNFLSFVAVAGDLRS